ncbi:exopolyphosphatase / guanosine-5'-triphosphate,3'-diphosphate pyrophosphatase [Caldanaerovirga acetigignens]|uniref:Exopolyphosphatase / guanosine-5'-triphosphate,3'-diphosphate pyrophosphatase n=1 Tax=Caldanaerovirga acetigignens TaxID=447595 RepID=A0A1M7GZK9_9FIRM|nr:Ppx/GppA phosphatase family protein [Caldanaerovirga acetigignens]SHM21735.1 exopolyphosphatase / guanosine-5'-triphosphate,3'-diphosphate pyrophosphatase [Caldanaerovirga acetigignens]
MKAAVIDLGSNSVRLLVAEIEEGKINQIFKDLATTRLGAGVVKNGMLWRDSIEKTVSAVEAFKNKAMAFGCQRIVAFATSAVREAKNGGEFMQELKERVGLEVRLLSGREEAKLSFIGAKESLKVEGRALVIDIGGGSTEFALGEKEIELEESLPMGAVRWTEQFLKSDPPKNEEIKALQMEARKLLSGFEKNFKKVKAGGVNAIGVGGTFTSLCAILKKLEEYHWTKVHGTYLEYEKMEKMTKELCGFNLDQRKKIPGLAAERADIIAAGALIALEIMRFLGLKTIVVSEADLMEGFLLTN